MRVDLEEIRALEPTEEPIDWERIPVDADELIERGHAALGESRGDYLRRKFVRKTIRQIHGLLNPQDDDPRLKPHTAEDHLEILSLLAQLHTTYADIMTRGGFSQYGDVSHAYGTAIDSISQREITERYFAKLLAERLQEAGDTTQTLVDVINNNGWILRERLSVSEWQSEEGQLRLSTAYAEAQEVVARYLHEQSPGAIVVKVGAGAVRYA